MSEKIKIRCVVNARPQTLDAYPMERLLDVLREQLKLTGTKEGCGEGECGACSVMIDGQIVNSCLVPVVQVEGAQIRAVSLLEKNPQPSEADIRNGLAGNLCRCTGYMKIFDSVVRACRQ